VRSILRHACETQTQARGVRGFETGRSKSSKALRSCGSVQKTSLKNLKVGAIRHVRRCVTRTSIP
jgi:hypothetical protein